MAQRRETSLGSEAIHPRAARLGIIVGELTRGIVGLGLLLGLLKACA